jgi:hypothetical protein
MKTLLTIALLLTGCGSTSLIHDGPGVDLYVYATPKISDTGYTLHEDFRLDEGSRFHETIQTITMPDIRPDWRGIESHRHYGLLGNEMLWPDVQSYRTTAPVWHHRRVNTVTPGRTEGAPWGTLPSLAKGVVMLDGWLVDGEPVGNRLYFAWGGKQGGRVVDQQLPGFTYETNAWSSTHPDNPNPGKATLRLRVLFSDDEREWME